MKACLILVAIAATCVAQLPPGWRPSGRALLLPSGVQEEPTTPVAQVDEKQSEKVLDSGEYYVLLEDGRLQMVKYTTAALKEQEDKSDVQAKNQQPQQYTQPQQTQQYPQSSKAQYPSKPQYYLQAQQYAQPQQTQQSQQAQQYRGVSPAVSKDSQANLDSSANLQLKYVQFPLPGSQFTQTKLQYTAPEADAKPIVEAQVADAKEATGYQATVQYRDVKPISAPIYAYNPTPLIRILKK